MTATLWGIHGGRDGSADPLFREKSLLALGWTALGDLSQLEADRGAFRAALVEAYPETLAGAVPVEAGVLFRFVHEMAIGDLVAYPSREDRCIHLFEVKGPYQYDATAGAEFPHRRPAKLVKSLPRGNFSQPALNEIGAAITLFKIKTNAAEFLTKLADQSLDISKPIAADLEPETSSSGPDFSESTQDFVIGRLGLHLKGHPFAHFVGHLLNLLGYRTQISPPGRDGGIDILVHNDPLGMQGAVMKVQVKSSEAQVGEKDLRDLTGLLHEDERGLFVTLGTYNLDARKVARGPKGIRLIDGPELVNLICEHYDQIDHRYRSLLPLRRIWVPDLPGNTGE
ncbi:restriction endonuclease [Geothrix sp. PMB-07]|uniref:restriction endonuclease n=1 Tax=Geothrix sp. PMB-07 TaxID=3068640 RepID=UPI0027424A62|nr:restriction endonuclease [Geothrix sp. PMB-07]WLT30897.1 restriction endonuclease [Geothrix sp. PMB-07]